MNIIADENVLVLSCLASEMSGLDVFDLGCNPTSCDLRREVNGVCLRAVAGQGTQQRAQQRALRLSRVLRGHVCHRTGTRTDDGIAHAADERSVLLNGRKIFYHIIICFLSSAGIQGFSRLVPGDVFEISIKHGPQKWKNKGRILKKSEQSWDHDQITFKVLLTDVLVIKVRPTAAISLFPCSAYRHFVCLFR